MMIMMMMMMTMIMMIIEVIARMRLKTMMKDSGL